MRPEIKPKDKNVLYALHYKGQLIGTFEWGQGGTTGLYGWRPPKKVYFTVGQANSGASHLPKEAIDDIEIVEYHPFIVVKKCSLKKKETRKLKKELSLLKRKRTWDFYKAAQDQVRIESEIIDLEEKLKKLKN